MTELQFISKGPPASDADIARAERELGVPIPEQYRRFLKQQDGARPKSNYFAPSAEGGAGVTDFLGVGAFDDAGLLQAQETYHDRVPQWLLPVAETEGGNLVLIALSGDDAGAVYFWDHEREADEGEPPTTENLQRLADSFDDYVAGLRHGPPPEGLGAPPVSVWVDPEFLKELRGQ